MLSRDLTGPLGLFVGFQTIRDYGVDKVFELENGNTDSSQRNIVYLVHGEKAGPVQAVAGESMPLRLLGGGDRDTLHLSASHCALIPRLHFDHHAFTFGPGLHCPRPIRRC